MNKKYMFGFLALFAVALVSAGIVNYLSNTVEEDIEVQSPLRLEMSGFDVVGPSDFDVHIADFTLYNDASVDVSTIVETSITGMDNESVLVAFSDDNVGEEFVSLDIGIKMPNAAKEVCVADGGIVGDEGDNNFYCYWNAKGKEDWTGVISGVYYVQMGDGSVPIGAGLEMHGRMKLQFNTNVKPANYTFVTEAVTVGGAKDL